MKASKRFPLRSNSTSVMDMLLAVHFSDKILRNLEKQPSYGWSFGNTKFRPDAGFSMTSENTFDTKPISNIVYLIISSTSDIGSNVEIQSNGSNINIWNVTKGKGLFHKYENST